MNDFCKMFSFLSALPLSFFKPMAAVAVTSLFSEISLHQCVLWPSIEAQTETLLQSIKMESFAESHPVLLSCSYRCTKRWSREERKRSITPSSIKLLSVQWSSGGSSFDNDSARCKERCRKEEKERQNLKTGKGGYNQVNEIKMPKMIQQVL